MKAQRAKYLLVGAGTVLALGSAMPAQAQVNDQIVLNIMRECAKIDDPSARLACYDNNVRIGGADRARPVKPGEEGDVFGSRAPVESGRAASAAQGFGAEDIRSPTRFQSQGVDEIRAKVAKIKERQPGIWLVTLESGAEWLFTDNVSTSYRPPKVGATVEISKAALGSFLMVVDGQAGVRVRRSK